MALCGLIYHMAKYLGEDRNRWRQLALEQFSRGGCILFRDCAFHIVDDQTIMVTASTHWSPGFIPAGILRDEIARARSAFAELTAADCQVAAIIGSRRAKFQIWHSLGERDQGELVHVED